MSAAAVYAEQVRGGVVLSRENLARFIEEQDAELASARAQLEQRDKAASWYRDHVTDDGIYDEAMWGDPFFVPAARTSEDDDE